MNSDVGGGSGRVTVSTESRLSIGRYSLTREHGGGNGDDRM